MRASQRTSPMNFQFTMVQARAASADGLSSRCGLVRESDGNSPFGKKRRSPAAPSGGIVSATPISTHTYLESSVHLLWQKPTWPGAVTGRQPFPVQNRSKSEACGPSTTTVVPYLSWMCPQTQVFYFAAASQNQATVPALDACTPRPAPALHHAQVHDMI